LENYPSPSNPLGVKGAGEGAIIPMGGLMANAVANALVSFEAMPNALPLSPARVWRMAQ
jgi:carbon-monoxide dehydrogenase large subunit